MTATELHDGFVPDGCTTPPVPAASFGAGTIWGAAYHAVTGAGRYVQGGGCLTVGVAGLVLGGGFGPFSKGFGLAAASLLEAEIVTADGTVRRVNACRDPDLFWALKGGGGGSFGVVTRLTLRHPRPAIHLRPREPDRPRRHRRRLLPPRRADRRLLRRHPVRPGLGRADRVHPRERARAVDGVPGPDAGGSRRHLAAVPRLGGRRPRAPPRRRADRARGPRRQPLRPGDAQAGARPRPRRRPARRAGGQRLLGLEPGRGRAGAARLPLRLGPGGAARARRGAPSSPPRSSPRPGTGGSRSTSTRASPAPRLRRSRPPATPR